jgi:cytoskeletal protein CcmA (bactofilin family)
MALFGKKESEGRAPGVQPPQINKDIFKDQKKVSAKPAPNSKTKATTNETTYLGKNLKIIGNISGEGSLIILGKFEGEFDIKGQVKVAQGAVIKGNIKATGVSINGILDGTVEASERILLDTTASIKGRLVTPKISIQDGAVFDGELQMSRKPEQVPKAATPEAKPRPKATAVSEIK